MGGCRRVSHSHATVDPVAISEAENFNVSIENRSYVHMLTHKRGGRGLPRANQVGIPISVCATSGETIVSGHVPLEWTVLAELEDKTDSVFRNEIIRWHMEYYTYIKYHQHMEYH